MIFAGQIAVDESLIPGRLKKSLNFFLSHFIFASLAIYGRQMWNSFERKKELKNISWKLLIFVKISYLPAELKSNKLNMHAEVHKN